MKRRKYKKTKNPRFLQVNRTKNVKHILYENIKKNITYTQNNNNENDGWINM